MPDDENQGAPSEGAETPKQPDAAPKKQPPKKADPDKVAAAAKKAEHEPKVADPEKLAAMAAKQSEKEKRADPEKLAAAAKKAEGDKAPVKKAEVTQSTRQRLAGQRKALREREFSESTGGAKKMLALGLPLVTLIVALAGYKYYQAGAPARELAAWYESFREATRKKDVKALLAHYSTEANHTLQHAFKIEQIRQSMGDDAARQAMAGRKLFVADSERPIFEKYVIALIDKGFVGCDQNPQGFLAKADDKLGQVLLEGPNIRVIRNAEGQWTFVERKRPPKPGKIVAPPKKGGAE